MLRLVDWPCLDRSARRLAGSPGGAMQEEGPIDSVPKRVGESIQVLREEGVLEPRLVPPILGRRAIQKDIIP